MRWQILLIPMVLVACSKMEPAVPANDAVLDGPVEGLSGEEHARFLRGDVAFNDQVFHAGNARLAKNPPVKFFHDGRENHRIGPRKRSLDWSRTAGLNDR